MKQLSILLFSITLITFLSCNKDEDTLTPELSGETYNGTLDKCTNIYENLCDKTWIPKTGYVDSISYLNLFFDLNDKLIYHDNAESTSWSINQTCDTIRELSSSDIEMYIIRLTPDTLVLGISTIITPYTVVTYYNDEEYNGDDSQLGSIGERYLGGVLAYVLQPGDAGYDSDVPHGLIAAPYDQTYENRIKWHYTDDGLTGATGVAIGTGRSNTDAIIAAYGLEKNAAKLCDDLVLNGYDDWFLPSKDELLQLYINHDFIGAFASSGYWSSSEKDQIYAWNYSFWNGVSFTDAKNRHFRVRAVRAF